MVNSVNDERLKSLAQNLDAILLKARADNTLSKYQSYFNKWLSWSSNFDEVDSFPAQTIHVALFLVGNIQAGESYSVIESCFYSIKHYHNIAMQLDPTFSNLISYIMDAAKRICHRPKKKKQPITAIHIKQIYELISRRGFSLLHQRNFTMMVLCFTGFLRYDEVSNLIFSDIVFDSKYMKVFIEKSKTDQFRDGAWVFIAKIDSTICPVKTLQDYINTAGLSGDDYLFRATTFFKSKNIHVLRKKNKPLSYSTARSAVLSI